MKETHRTCKKPDAPYMTLDEFFEYLEDERNSRPWYKKLVDGTYRWLWYKPLTATRNFFGDAVNVFQRARYGIGYRDMWHFPSYFAGMLAHAMELEAEESFTYPGEERGFTGEEWKAYAKGIAAALREYQEAFDSTEYVPGWHDDLLTKQERARQALHRFASEFEYVGD